MDNFITIDNKFDDVKKKNFMIYGFISSFVWMCFHFTLIFFFLIQLQSPLVVGIFLGIGNLISFLADSPIGVFQKYFKPKKIFLFGAFLMLLVSLIFLYFIYKTSTIEVSLEFNIEALKQLFGSVINVLLLLIAVALYGIIKEISDVTSYSYIMNNADPSEYATLFSKRNIWSGIGSLVGLILSGIILAFNTLIAVTILVLLIIIFILFIIKYFDNSKNELKIDDIKKLKLISKDSVLNSIKDYKINIITNKVDLIEKTKNIKVLFLKPIEIREQINFKEIYENTIGDIKSFYKIMFISPYNYRLLIIGIIFTLFGFWDTFVTSFLIDFINGILVKNSTELSRFNLQNILTAYVFIALLAIPAYGAQVPLINISKKIGLFKVLMFGVLISGISIFFFGFFDSIFIILLLGLANSIGYAAGMPLSQGEFSNEYNKTYADKKNLKQIDANASSAPIKMLSNLANVGGLVLGGILIQIFGYIGTFIVFGSLLIYIFILSVLKKKEYKF
ncbi:MAG: MFS transporter [Candidatus Gracilibacteria bacterium]|nr:MFS transporter [Candidatus Gracilibacteria bacterium]